MKTILVLFSFFLISCGSRNVNLQKEKTEQKENTQISADTKAEITDQRNVETSYKLSETAFGFSIEPINGNASFHLNFGGKEISGETSGKMNFTTSDKQEEKNKKETHKIHTTYQTQTTYQTEITYKSVLKNKQTERKAFPVWVWILTGVLLTVLAQLLWSRVKPKFNLF